MMYCKVRVNPVVSKSLKICVSCCPTKSKLCTAHCKIGDANVLDIAMFLCDHDKLLVRALIIPWHFSWFQ